MRGRVERGRDEPDLDVAARTNSVSDVQREAATERRSHAQVYSATQSMPHGKPSPASCASSAASAARASVGSTVSTTSSQPGSRSARSGTELSKERDEGSAEGKSAREALEARRPRSSAARGPRPLRLRAFAQEQQEACAAPGWTTDRYEQLEQSKNLDREHLQSNEREAAGARTSRLALASDPPRHRGPQVMSSDQARAGRDALRPARRRSCGGPSEGARSRKTCRDGPGEFEPDELLRGRRGLRAEGECARSGGARRCAEKSRAKRRVCVEGRERGRGGSERGGRGREETEGEQACVRSAGGGFVRARTPTPRIRRRTGGTKPPALARLHLALRKHTVKLASTSRSAATRPTTAAPPSKPPSASSSPRATSSANAPSPDSHRHSAARSAPPEHPHYRLHLARLPALTCQLPPHQPAPPSPRPPTKRRFLAPLRHKAVIERASGHLD